MAYTLFFSGSSEEFEGHHQQTHFLESCFMCRKPLGLNRDIFMYRGITAFCSYECRQEQIEMDEAKERSWNLKASKRAPGKTSPPPTKSSSTASATTTTTPKSATAGIVRVA